MCWLNQRVLGSIAPDGGFRTSAIAPGDHTIELRRDQHEPKRFTRTFRPGQTVLISSTEATLNAIRVTPPPAPASTPPPAAPPPPKPAPKIVNGTIANFETPAAWHEEQGVWRHRGAAALTYALPPTGIFTFSIYQLKGGKVSWFLDYTDDKNYLLFELDEKNFWAKVVQNGKVTERKKVAHKLDKSMRVWNIQIDANAQRVVHKIQDDNGWMELDTWSESGRDFSAGKFGILVRGSDEVGLSSFQFTGR
ncbi:MAG: hypothetical protein WDO18_04580 [Acidobacteriota bacterium]